MEHSHIIDYSLIAALFLLGTALLQILTNRIAFPYTVALLIVGFLAQFLMHFFHYELHITLSSDVIYYILLPLLLFEAAIHINIHQFKLQFKTITFLATFGLLLSIYFVGVGLAFLIGLPFDVALLFGAIISATDPIAVLALFKTLGAPKRLALIADGESMFNDATGVIAFRLVSGFVIANNALQSTTIFQSISNFFYVFIGSIILGVAFGYIASLLIRRLREERILVTAMITAVTLGSFAGAEHFFHLSGVITTVIAGLTFGNLAHGRLRGSVIDFLHEYFGYIGFLALSLVFFFASFSLDLTIFSNQIPLLLIVIFVVLVARAISVYITVFLSNNLPLFKDEPDIPMSWQHILVWGGLRGVIPLVLVYTLPDTYEYKDMLFSFTFATLLFTLFVNGLTIKWLLLKLKLHIPRKEERIINDELQLFQLEETRKKLENLKKREFIPAILRAFDKKLSEQEQKYKKELVELSNSDEFLLSLRLQALEIERQTLHTLYEQRRFKPTVMYEFESELDLQQDALEYPELHSVKVVERGGEINTKKLFRKRLLALRKFIATHKYLSNFLHITIEDIVLERYILLRARLFTSYAVLDYLDRLKNIFHDNKKIVDAIEEVRTMQNEYIQRNYAEHQEISEKYPERVKKYQEKIISQIIYA